MRLNLAVYESFLAAALVLGLLIGCASSTPEEEPGGWKCEPLPTGFDELDLVGTWRSVYYPRLITDTLILREDGTYRQIYDNNRTDRYIETPWNRWYVEYGPEGGAYLHLVGMHYCLSTGDRCAQAGGGGRPYYDRCQGRLVSNMGREVILIIEGSEGFKSPDPRIESVPRGILLWHLRSSAESPDKFFILQEHEE
jgi:hypothetical protein